VFPEADGPQCYIVWNKTPFSSFQNGYLKQLNLDTFFCLPTAAAKRAYRYLDADLPGRGDREYDLQLFACEHVGIARNYKPSRLRDEVEKTVVKPLEQADVIETLPAKRRFFKRDSRFKVIFGRKRHDAALPPEESLPAQTQPKPAAAAASPLFAELKRFGIGGKAARDFIAAHAADYIDQKIDGHNVSERRADLETRNAGADLPDRWGRPPLVELRATTLDRSRWGSGDGMCVRGINKQHGKLLAIPARFWYRGMGSNGTENRHKETQAASSMVCLGSRKGLRLSAGNCVG
jgi:hypothetical protein